jgi:hypothetical protein
MTMARGYAVPANTPATLAKEKKWMRAKKAQPEVPPAKLALYDQLVATLPHMERKGATTPYTSWNGHMFSFLALDGSLGLRLPQEARDRFLKHYQTTLVEAHGTIMKEYVAVPGDLLQQTQELQPYFALSFEYVQTLKPNAPKKGKTTNT